MSSRGFEELDKKLEGASELMDRIENDAAPAVCEVMRAMAVRYITDQHAVDTGRLRNSVGAVDNEIISRKGETVVTMGIDCPVEYGIFIEYGTGPKGDPAIPHTSKDKWVYADDKGFHTAHSQYPRPFMRPALYNHIDVYKDIINGTITEVFE